MLDLSLTAAERTAYFAALRSDEQHVRVRVQVLDRNEKTVHALDFPASQVVDGSVDVDARGDVTRSLGLTFVDESKALGFDAAAVTRTGLFADNLVAVEKGIYVDALARWIDCPVFWGTLTEFERDNEIVTIEGQGKDALGLDPHFVTNGYTLRKGRLVTSAIRDVMDRVGETRYNLPEVSTRLPRPRAVEPEDEPWDVVKFGYESHERRVRGKGKRRHKERVTVNYNGLVSLLGPFYAYYNGRGQLTARRRSSDPVLALVEGRDLKTRPTVRFDALAARNHVVVTGAKVTRGKKPHRHQVQMRAAAGLRSEHPLSPFSLRRGPIGAEKPRRMTEFVVAENLKTERACRSLAERILAEVSADGLTLEFDCLPFPMLEELDMIHVETREYALSMRLQAFSIPLGTGLMRVGWERD